MGCFHGSLIRQASIVLVSAGASGCWGETEPDLPDTHQRSSNEVLPTTPSVSQLNVATKQPKKSSASHASSVEQSSTLLQQAAVLSPGDRSRTSWENPFRPGLWSCDGWRIDEDSMHCESDGRPPATFLRSYREVTVEFSLTTESDEDIDKGPSSHQPNDTRQLKPEIRLFNPNDESWLTAQLNDDTIRLSAHTKQTEKKLRESPASLENSTAATIRLTMTPNRILVAVDGRLAINASRPSEFLEQEFLLQFLASPAGAVLSDLRIEGE